MPLNQEQQNVKALAQQVGADMKIRYPMLAASADVTAYAGALNTLPVSTGDVYTYIADSTLSLVPGMILPATGKGSGRWLKNVDVCNVKRDFLADNKGATDSATAFQQAIDFASALSAINGGQYRMTLNVPNGFYLINKTLNLTNRTGITFRGMGGSYINTCLIGNTNRAGSSPVVIDGTGSGYFGLENMLVLSDAGWGSTASTIGVLVALSEDANGAQLNGLAPRIHNTRVEMHSDPNANGGLGTIAYLNVRSEEGGVSDSTFRANRPAVLSNSANLSATGINYNVTSIYANVATHGNGSMGVQDWTGRMSLHGINKYAPALTLIGVNTFRFHGYMGRPVQDAGTAVTAIDTFGQCDGLQISGTVECYPQILNTHGGKITASNIRIITANQLNPSGVNVCDLTGSPIHDTDIRVVFNNPAERSNRVLFYHAPINGGNSAATGSLSNCKLSSPEWPDNTTFISANLRRNIQNVELLSGQTVRKGPGGFIEYVANYPFPLGKVGSVTNTLIRFDKADKATANSLNAGSYSVLIEGVITIGGIGSGGGSSFIIRAAATVQQFNNGDKGPVGSSATIVAGSGISGGTSLSAIAVDIDLSGSVGVIKLTPTTGANGTDEPISFMGSIRLLASFAVNQSTLFA